MILTCTDGPYIGKIGWKRQMGYSLACPTGLTTMTSFDHLLITTSVELTSRFSMDTLRISRALMPAATHTY